MHHGTPRDNRCCRHRPASNSSHLAGPVAGLAGSIAHPGRRSCANRSVSDHIRTVPSRHITPAARPPVGVGQFRSCWGGRHGTGVANVRRAFKHRPPSTGLELAFRRSGRRGLQTRPLRGRLRSPVRWRLSHPQAGSATRTTSSARALAATPSQKSTAARSYNTPIRNVWPRQCSNVRCPGSAPLEPRSSRSSLS